MARTLTPHTLELFFPLLKTIRNNGNRRLDGFLHSQVAPRSPKTSHRGLGYRFARISSRVSEPRAAVAQLPVNNRPETGSPPPRLFSTATGWFSARIEDRRPGRPSLRSAYTALSCSHAEAT